MRASRVIALVIGCLLALPGIGMLASGGTLGVAQVRDGDGSGFVQLETSHVQSRAGAVTEGTIDVIMDSGTPQWLVDHLATDVRLDVAAPYGTAVFVGVAPTSAVDAYLAGTPRDDVVTSRRGDMTRQPITGPTPAGPPGDQTIWVASTAGNGPLQLDWRATTGSWTVVVMNVDATPGVEATVTPNVRSAALAPLTVGLLVAGLVDLAGSVALIIFGLRRRGRGIGRSDATHLREHDLHASAR